MTHEPTRRRGGAPRELFVLIAVSLLMSSMQFTMISISLPDMVADFDASIRWVSWTISVFAMAQAVALPVLGGLSDRIGRRPIFIVGTLVFGAASLACAVAPNLAALIAARAGQGMAAGSLLPSAYGIIGDVFQGPTRTRIMGLISAVIPVGAIIGPNLGGLLVDSFGWRATFLANVPVAFGAAAWAAIRLPGLSSPTERTPVDFGGAVLLAATVGLAMLALTELGQPEGTPTPIALIGASLAGSVLFGWLLIQRERRVTAPLVQLDLLARREFVFVNALNFMYGVCIFGMVSFIPLYVQERYELTASQAGLLLTPRAVAMVLVSVIASFLLDRSGFRVPIATGLLVIAATAVLLSYGTELSGLLGQSELVYLSVVIILVGVGLGAAGPSVNQAGLDLLPESIAAVTGLRGMFRALGGVFGTASIAALASRAPTVATGLEWSFVILAAVALAATLLVRGVPEVASRTRASARTEATTSDWSVAKPHVDLAKQRLAPTEPGDVLADAALEGGT